MFIYTVPRGKGKTTKLIEWLLHDPDHRAVVVADEMRREHLIRRLYRAYATIPLSRQVSLRDHHQWWATRVVTVHNFKAVTDGRDGTLLAVDDVDEVLQVLFRRAVDLVTTSEPVLDHYEGPRHSDPTVIEGFAGTA